MSQDDKLKQLESELHLQKQEIKSLQGQLDSLNQRLETLQQAGASPIAQQFPQGAQPTVGNGQQALQEAQASGNGQQALQEAQASGNGQQALQGAQGSGNEQQALQEAQASGNGQQALQGAQGSGNEQQALQEAQASGNGQQALQGAQASGNGQQALQEAQASGNGQQASGYGQQALQGAQASGNGQEPVQSEPVDWEHLIGRVWLPRIFVLVLLLGVIWGFSAAVAEGLLNEPVRCFLGALAGAVFLWFGNRQVRAQRTVLGQVLLGGSLAIWLLTVFAAHMLYGLLGTGAALGLNMLIIAYGIALTELYRSQTLGILTAIAGLLVPFLLESGDPKTLFFVSFEVISSLIYLALALRHNFKALYLVNFLLFHAALLFYGLVTGTEETHPFGFGVLIHHLALLAAMIILKANESRFLTLFTSAVFTIGWWYLFYGLEGTALANYYTWLLFGFTLFYGVLASYYHKHGESSRFAVTLTVTAFSMMFYLLQIFNGTAEAIALVIEGAVLFALAFYLRARVQGVMSVGIFTVGLILTVFREIPQLLSGQTLAWLVLLAALTAVLAFASKLIRARAAAGEDQETEWGVYKAAAIVTAILLLAFLTQITDLLAAPFSNDIQHFAITAVWALYAVAAILFGTIRDSSLSRIAGIVLLFGTLLKLFIFDLPTVSILIRALLFIGLGLIGLAISRLFYQRK